MLAFDHGTRDTGFGVGVISNGTEPGTDVGFTDGAAICNRTPAVSHIAPVTHQPSSTSRARRGWCCIAAITEPAGRRLST